MWVGLVPALAEAPNVPENKEVVSDIVLEQKSFIKGNFSLKVGTETLLWHYASVYQIDYQFFKNLADCECDLRITDHLQCKGDKGKALGRFQFWQSTFKEYCAGDYYNEEDQINCAAKMIKEGKCYLWTCCK